MSALPHPNSPKARRLRTVRQRPVDGVTQLVQPAASNELKKLLRLEKFSAFIMLSLVTAALSVYASTVDTSKTWSKEYKTLQKLRNDDRNLITNNEVLKSNLVKQAQSPTSGLTDLHPSQSIYLPSVDNKPKPELKKEIKSTLKIGQDLKAPVSY
jgi:hypothetical protein